MSDLLMYPSSPSSLLAIYPSLFFLPLSLLLISVHSFHNVKTLCRMTTTSSSPILLSTPPMHHSSSETPSSSSSSSSSSPFDPHWALYPKTYVAYATPVVNAVDTLNGNVLDETKALWRNVPWSEPFGDIQGSTTFLTTPPNNEDEQDHIAGDWPPPDLVPALTQFKAVYDDQYLYIGALLYPLAPYPYPCPPPIPSPNFHPHIPEDTYSSKELDSASASSFLKTKCIFSLPTEAHFTERNSPIYQRDSDFEVFVDVQASCHHYKELEINALNTVWNLYLDKPYRNGGHEHSGRVANSSQSDDYYEVHYQKTAVHILSGQLNDYETGQGAWWTVELALSYRDLYDRVPPAGSSSFATAAAASREKDPEAPTSSPNRKAPTPGSWWRVNFSRVEQQGRINWTWQPQIVWDPVQRRYAGQIDMHLPDAWGYLVFDGELPPPSSSSSSPVEETTSPTAWPVDEAVQQSRRQMDSGKAPDQATSPTVIRDESWPARVVAMMLYYAQYEYKDRVGQFTDQLDHLVVQHNLLEPLRDAVRLWVGPDLEKPRFVITVRWLDDMAIAVNDERLVQLIPFDKEQS